VIFVEETVGVAYSIEARINGEGEGRSMLLVLTLEIVLKGNASLPLLHLMLMGEKQFSM
jgi:hypothetical protein